MRSTPQIWGNAWILFNFFNYSLYWTLFGIGFRWICLNSSSHNAEVRYTGYRRCTGPPYGSKSQSSSFLSIFAYTSQHPSSPLPQEIFLSLTLCNLNLRVNKPWARGNCLFAVLFMKHFSPFFLFSLSIHPKGLSGMLRCYWTRWEKSQGWQEYLHRCCGLAASTCFLTQFPQLALGLILQTYLGLHLSVEIAQGVCQEYCAIVTGAFVSSV